MEKRKVLITSLQSKLIQTQYGMKTKLNIVGSDGITYGSWESQWNSTWKVGDTVEGEYTQQTGKNGQVYNNLACPAELKQGTFNGGGSQKFDDIMNMLGKMNQTLLDIQSKIAFKPVAANEPPPFEDDIKF